jgi:hypothetical protein
MPRAPFTFTVLRRPNLGADPELSGFVVHEVIAEARRLKGKPAHLVSVTVGLHELSIALEVTDASGFTDIMQPAEAARVIYEAVARRAARA